MFFRTVEDDTASQTYTEGLIVVLLKDETEAHTAAIFEIHHETRHLPPSTYLSAQQPVTMTTQRGSPGACACASFSLAFERAASLASVDYVFG